MEEKGRGKTRNLGKRRMEKEEDDEKGGEGKERERKE